MSAWRTEDYDVCGQLIFTEHMLCARHCPRHRVNRKMRKRNGKKETFHLSLTPKFSHAETSARPHQLAGSLMKSSFDVGTLSS